MNVPHSAKRSTAAVIVQSLLWLWLIALSILVTLVYQTTEDQKLESRLERLEAGVALLNASVQTVQKRPAAATTTDLQNTRQVLEARIVDVEKSLGNHATAADLQAVRAEIDQINARQTKAQAAPTVQPRRTRPNAATSTLRVLPFQVVAAELRAGERSVSVAPASGEFSPDQVQVLLPGDAIGDWRLRAIEGDSAVFQAGTQTRRVAIP